MNVHEKEGRLLLHTRHLAMCPDTAIKDIADKVREFMKKENIFYNAVFLFYAALKQPCRMIAGTPELT